MTMDELQENIDKNYRESKERMSLKDVEDIINILLWEQERMTKSAKIASKRVLKNILGY
jgi:hypothetical protein